MGRLTENGSLVEPASAESGFKAEGKRDKGGGSLEIPRSDLRLSFAQHLAAPDSKLRATSASLGRLMPKPRVYARKLYVKMIHSYVQRYGVGRSRFGVYTSQEEGNSALTGVNRMVMAYRDVAADDSCSLSRTPSLNLLTLERLYRVGGRLRRNALRKVVREKVFQTWWMRLEDGRKLYGGEILRVLDSRLPEWMGREHIQEF